MNLSDLWKWLKQEFRWRVLVKRYEIYMTEEFKRKLAELPEEAQAEILKSMERIRRNPYSGERLDLEEEGAEGVVVTCILKRRYGPPSWDANMTARAGYRAPHREIELALTRVSSLYYAF